MERKPFLEQCDTMGVIEITADGNCRLLRTLNPDASNLLQGEEYNINWSIPIQEAAKSFLEKGFWNTWSEVSGTICGGIRLYDNLSERAAKIFIGVGKLPGFQGYNDIVARAITVLPPGKYLFIVPTK